MLPTRWFDLAHLRRIAIWKDVELMGKILGWDTFFTKNWKTYTSLTLEVLSTIFCSFKELPLEDPTEEAITFRLADVEPSMTRDKFSVTYGFKLGGEETCPVTLRVIKTHSGRASQARGSLIQSLLRVLSPTTRLFARCIGL